MTGTYKNRFTGQVIVVNAGDKRVRLQANWSLSLAQFRRAVKNGAFVKIAD